MNPDNILVEHIAPEPNRWAVLTEVRLVHPTYPDEVRGKVVGGAPRQDHDTLAGALAEARALITDAAAPPRPGWTRQVELVGVRVRAYHQPGPFAPLGLGAPEWQQAWADGPGADPTHHH